MVPARAFRLLEKPAVEPTIAQIPTFLPFWSVFAAGKAAAPLDDDFLCKRESLLFICRTFGRTALGLRAAAVAAPGILCGGREKGARSLWTLRVRCLPCAIILADALTERVWSAAPGLREKRSWAASLFTLARARRSLPSSDLNGHCLSRGAVSLATRGQKRACRARHPAAKQGGTAEFSRPWVSEKRPRTVFSLPSAGGRGMGPVQTGKEDR